MSSNSELFKNVEKKLCYSKSQLKILLQNKQKTNKYSKIQGNKVMVSHSLCLPRIQKMQTKSTNKIKFVKILQCVLDRSLILVLKISRFIMKKNHCKYHK